MLTNSTIFHQIRELIAQNELLEEIGEYKQIIEKIKTNRGAGTSEMLKNKTTDDLDEKEIIRLFEKERVIRIFDELEVSPTDFNTHQKLRYLSLAENGHIFKGTFLCLGKRNQIQTICHTATESKFIFFKGIDRTEILVLETLNGNLLQQFEKMLMLLRTHIPLGRDREKNEDRYEIPMLAIREFVANAFVHRDFSAKVQSYIQIELFDDRLEIKSPGHLPKNLDVNKIEGTILVNPVVAAVFHLFKYIERAGTGIQVAQQTLQNNHLQSAKIENIDHPNMVKVTIFRNKQHENVKNKGSFFDNILKGLKGVLGVNV
jgi:predicted HTH transcriptional regulator